MSERGVDPPRPADWPGLLAAAISGRMTSAYQPIVDVVRGAVVGYEALVRFPELGGPGPELWFTAAREAGVAPELEAAALRSALSRFKELPPNCFLTVNVSPDLLPTAVIRTVWDEVGPLAGVIVELTENAKINDYARLEPDLHRLRAAGAMIGIDDVGSGYAGLTHMIQLRPALIKLDRELVRGIDRDQTKRALAEMIGTFAGRIDAWLLAEGVETAAELEAVAALGIPLVQGFHLGRPGPPWVRLTDAAERTLLTDFSSAERPTVRAQLEHAPCVGNAADVASVFTATDCDFVVLQDADNRPVAIITDRHAPVPVVVPGLKINVDTPLHDAALRALTRTTTDWSAPLMCTDNAGRYVGIVRMERLVHDLASRP